MRELVGIDHRYVRSLMIALIRGTGTQAEALLKDSFTAVPEVTTREQEKLLKQLAERLTVVPRTVTAPTVVKTAPEEDHEIMLELAKAGEPDPESPHDLFIDDVAIEEEDPSDPVQQAISTYLDHVVSTLRPAPYKEKFYIRNVIIEGKSYLMIVTGNLKTSSEELNIYGTTGNKSNFNDLDDAYFYCKGDRRVTAQRELDDVGPFSHIVLWGWALHNVPGREFRFWINRKGSKDLAKVRIRMDPTHPNGFRVTKTYKKASEKPATASASV